MTDWLFDTPWWLPAGLAVAAIALFVAGNNRQDAALKRLAAAALGLAVVLFAVSYFVNTPKEVVAKRTREFVSSVEKKDRPTIERLLHPAAHFLDLNKAKIVEIASKAMDTYRIKDVRITSMDVRSTGDTIVAVFQVGSSVEVQGFGGSVPTQWQITWEKLGDEWLARGIDGTIQGIEMKDAVNRLR
ncbi:MAG TPA: hypothetical protein VEA69_00610 [Tepidisphaeraceae bacterium]|nr:hypothetical protein [Tepidisphaeraceae bacterium]